MKGKLYKLPIIQFIQYVIYNTATVRAMIEPSSVCNERRDPH